MTNRLDAILLQKQKEVILLKAQLAENNNHPIHDVLNGKCNLVREITFKQALSQGSIAIIAEIKRRSPSKGQISKILDPVKLAEAYKAGGASALSILTDTQFFDGHLDDLIGIRHHFPEMPILRKDFIVDKIQIAEAKLAKASAVLCIVAVLGKELKFYLDYARALNIQVLVEVHDEDELLIALDSGAEIIGINNRDLKTFEVDTNRASELLAKIPKGIIKVVESGIDSPLLVKRYALEGFDAALIGEALVKSQNPAAFIKACS